MTGTVRMPSKQHLGDSRVYRILIFAFVLFIPTTSSSASKPLEDALQLAGENASEIESALEETSDARREGMRFLISNMPERDLRSLKSEFLVENVNLAYDAYEKSKWREQIPKDVFLNNVLPYANINENRDRWRKDFYQRFHPLVAEANSPGEAAAILNNKVFPQLKVKYSTKRRRADQGPMESMESGLASCTGLSILLIDACRAVGVPARFVGTPLWSDRSGNHSWVEVWDDGWHFTGAAEPSGMDLDKAWFIGRASKAQRDHRLHAIYAVSYKKTPITFPLVWNRNIDYVFAVNVTDRYANKVDELPDGFKLARFRAFDSAGQRCCAPLTVKDDSGEVVFEGKTNDERFDANDHVATPLKKDVTYTVQVGDEPAKTLQFKKDGDAELFTYRLAARDTTVSEDDLSAKFEGELTKQQAAEAASALIAARKVQVKKERKQEMDDRKLKIGEHEMPFFYKVYGEKPKNGRSLFISMHGGGGAPPRVNDSQWNNQKRLYKPEEGVYVAPRAPSDTWNLWHRGHIDPLFDRLIENMVVFEDVDPNRVYIMGYSAGGDGVYQLAPRMADRWAAAAMMAGHPNETKPDGLRNIGFALYMGGRDGAYKRNKVAAEWKEKLAKLKADDPDGYEHQVMIYPNKGHWMDGEDKSALPWMQKFTRHPMPKKIVWLQDDVTHSRFYWLHVDEENQKSRSRVEAEIDGQTIELSAEGIEKIEVRLNDQLVDLDQPIIVKVGDAIAFEGKVDRSFATIKTTLDERGDPALLFSGTIEVNLPK